VSAFRARTISEKRRSCASQNYRASDTVAHRPQQKRRQVRVIARLGFRFAGHAARFIARRRCSARRWALLRWTVMAVAAAMTLLAFALALRLAPSS
jgi:hypothetical protein